ncbi:hypothetical protein ACQ33O_07975 [Ferruginibacter sp. SUN002]|uniref:hypothetical protein n=1 Tax=Ferruginibacter sp. SUN002 TaxID=2937789 RepID=UPI003D35ADE8
MKKIVLLISIVWAGTAHAQKLDDIREALGKKEIDYAGAKEMVDKYLANPKNAAKSDGWYYKGYIYNGLSKGEATKGLCADCRMEALEAFKKYQELDPKNILLKLEFNGSLFDLYNGYFDLGAKAYGERNYKDAFLNFKNALIVEDYIRSKDLDYQGTKFPALDTSLVQNTAIAARLDKNDDGAIPYCKLITDAEVAGKEYLDIYEFVAEYYKNKKDATNFAAALAKGRKVFPDEAYWTAIEMESVGENSTKEELFVKYDELIQKNPTDYTLVYNYGVELYNFIYITHKDNPANKAYKAKLTETFKKAIALKSTPETNLLMAKHLYYQSDDLADEAKLIKGTKPEDVKKRKALNDEATASRTECIAYCEAANKYYAGLSTLQSKQKTDYKSSLVMLQNIYQLKNDKVKVEELEKVLVTLD